MVTPWNVTQWKRRTTTFWPCIVYRTPLRVAPQANALLPSSCMACSAPVPTGCSWVQRSPWPTYSPMPATMCGWAMLVVTPTPRHTNIIQPFGKYSGTSVGMRLVYTMCPPWLTTCWRWQASSRCSMWATRRAPPSTWSWCLRNPRIMTRSSLPICWDPLPTWATWRVHWRAPLHLYWVNLTPWSSWWVPWSLCRATSSSRTWASKCARLRHPTPTCAPTRCSWLEATTLSNWTMWVGTREGLINFILYIYSWFLPGTTGAHQGHFPCGCLSQSESTFLSGTQLGQVPQVRLLRDT